MRDETIARMKVTERDFETVLRSKGDGRSYFTYCPLPDCYDESGHCEVDMQKFVFYCHRCGRGGSLPRSLLLQDRVQRSDPVSRPVTEGRVKFRPIYRSEKEPRCKYLRERGLNYSHIDRLDPHQGPDHRFVYFPIRRDGLIVYWVGRNITNHGPSRYWYPPSSYSEFCPRNQVLWGLEDWEPGTMFLVEGIFDAVWARSCVALLGCRISAWQVNDIYQRGPTRVVVALDGEAMSAAHAVIARLWKGGVTNTQLCVLPYGADPDLLNRQGRLISDYLIT